MYSPVVIIVIVIINNNLGARLLLVTGDSPIWIYDLLLSLGTDDVDAGDSPIWIDVLLFSLGTYDAAYILFFSSVFEGSIHLSSIRLKTDSSMIDLAKIQIEA